MNTKQIAAKTWALLIKRMNGVPAQTDEDCIDIIKAAIEKVKKAGYMNGFNDAINKRVETTMLPESNQPLYCQCDNIEGDNPDCPIHLSRAAHASGRWIAERDGVSSSGV